MTLEGIAEKKIPGLLTLVIIALFSMYIKVEFLEDLSVKAPKIIKEKHKEYDLEIRNCRENDIKFRMEIDYIKEKIAKL